MKLSLPLLLASMATTVSATKSVSASNAAKVLRAARRLEQGDNENEGDGEGDDANANQYDYLAKYSLKMIGCKAGEQVVDADSGEIDYSSVIFRLCPSENGCADESVTGCSEGYGDFVVGMNTFVDAYFEDQRDNMNWDDNFDVDRYAECAEYEMEGDDDGANAQQYYIGPTCTEDELDIRLALFTDEVCTVETATTFESISNGWTMPFSSGGMVSTYCSDCLEYNEDDAAYELREMCTNLYAGAAYACEQSMEYFSYYGQNVQGCDYVQENLPSAVQKAQKKGGKIFGWIIFAFIAIGFAAYIVWWRKKKQATAGLVA